MCELDRSRDSRSVASAYRTSSGAPDRDRRKDFGGQSHFSASGRLTGFSNSNQWGAVIGAEIVPVPEWASFHERLDEHIRRGVSTWTQTAREARGRFIADARRSTLEV